MSNQLNILFPHLQKTYQAVLPFIWLYFNSENFQWFQVYPVPSSVCSKQDRSGSWRRDSKGGTLTTDQLNYTEHEGKAEALFIQINNRFRPWLKEELHSWKLRDVKSSMHPCKMPPGGDETPQFGAIHPSIQLSILSHFLVESASSVWAFSDWGLSGYFLINCLFFFFI